MKIQTTKEKLLTAIQLTERIVGKKESLPVLSCLLLDVGGELTVRATNLEAGIEVKVVCDVQEKGTIAVPASILSQTIRSIISDTITLSSDEGNLIIQSKGTKTLIKAVPHDEFPLLSTAAKGKSIKVPKEELVRGVESVIYAASPSMIRPELGSVYIMFKQGSIICVATDSFRLAEKTIAASGVKESKEILIPLKHAGELAYVLERLKDEQIMLFNEDAQLTVEGENTRFISRIVEGNFPDYRTIIPKTPTTEATLLKNDFAEMLRKARVFSGEEQQVGLHVYPKKKIFTATAQSAAVGEMSDSMEAAISGEDIDINFHIGYLADCLASIPADSITLSFSGVGRALVIRGVSDSSFMYLVMPLNR